MKATVKEDAMDKDLLDMLEELLSITERFKDEMEPQEYKRWQDISAKCADARDGEDV